MTQASAFENETLGDSVDKSLLCIFEHTQLSVCFIY
jgi:hypothetical protein